MNESMTQEYYALKAQYNTLKNEHDKLKIQHEALVNRVMYLAGMVAMFREMRGR